MSAILKDPYGNFFADLNRQGRLNITQNGLSISNILATENVEPQEFILPHLICMYDTFNEVQIEIKSMLFRGPTIPRDYQS